MDRIPHEPLDQLVATANALDARWREHEAEAVAAETISRMAAAQAKQRRDEEIRARVTLVRVVQAIDRLAAGGATAAGLDTLPLPSYDALYHTGEGRIEDPCPTLRERQMQRQVAAQAVAS